MSSLPTPQPTSPAKTTTQPASDAQATSTAPTPPPALLIDVLSRLPGMARTSGLLLSNVLQNSGKLLGDTIEDSTSVAREAVELGTLVAERVDDVRTFAKAAPRLTRIVKEIAKIAASYGWHRARFEVAGLTPSAESLAALHRVNADRLYRLCIEMRGAVLKVGQLISCRADLLPHAFVERLSALQDQVPPVPFEEIERRVEYELGAPLKELFVAFEPEPIAAASLAQVHAATTADGTAVVVKVQVPGIEEAVEADLAALRLLATAMNDMVPQADLVTIARELSRSVTEELDFERESANATRFGVEFTDDPNVEVPRMVETHSTARVLTMERLMGQRITDYLDACEQDGERGRQNLDTLLDIVVRSTCRQVLEHGHFHADPHPGNFMALDGPRLGVLDFGSVMVFDRNVRRACAQLVGAVLGGNAAGLAQQLEVLGFTSRMGNGEDVQRFAQGLIDLYRVDMTTDFSGIDPFDQLEKAMGVGRRYPNVQIPQNFVLLGRVFAALGGLVLRYRPRVNMAQMVLPYLGSALSS